MSDQPKPRISPQPSAQWAPQVRPILARDRGEQPRLGELNLFATLARHPDLLRTWLPLGTYLLGEGELPFADRELLILRTGYNCRAPYEWAQHAEIARRGGLAPEIIERIPEGPGAAGWDERSRLLLRAADELHADTRICDATWEGLVGHLDQRQLIELTFLVGHYHLVAFALNTLGVQPEPGLPPMP
jgi:alkylhydroperoxidase family enzyme